MARSGKPSTDTLQLGHVVQIKYGFRVQARLDGKSGSIQTGPYRTERAEAEADLEFARAKGTRDAMKAKLNELKQALQKMAAEQEVVDDSGAGGGTRRWNKAKDPVEPLDLSQASQPKTQCVIFKKMDTKFQQNGSQSLQGLRGCGTFFQQNGS
jgi:hypothetical protein